MSSSSDEEGNRCSSCGSEQLISNLEGELALLKEKEKEASNRRRIALERFLDFKGSIRVTCRIRPFLVAGRGKVRQGKPIAVQMEKVVVNSKTAAKEFKFDKIFGQEASQEEIFAEIEPILRSAIDGHNVTVLAYGQTGTGKTYTMDGSACQPGIIPRALEELFRHSSDDLHFSISMLEVYMGNLRDLLAPRRCNLNIQTDSKGFVEIEGLKEFQIPCLEKAKWWYGRGRLARSTSWTNVNEASSRSHCLTRITIRRESDDRKWKSEVSKVWMVDLGGSERLLKTGASGLTLDEGRAINLSLSALGDVIAALRKRRGHVPYRNSKLTQILKDSLGLGSKVLMVVHISPFDNDIGETLCSLSFANRARGIDTDGYLTEEFNKQKLQKLLEFGKDVRQTEEEYQQICRKLKRISSSLSEKKMALSNAADKHARNNTTVNDESHASAQVMEKMSGNRAACSLPRFMSSTIASRQRQSAAEKEAVNLAKGLRSVGRGSVQFASSLSVGYSENRQRGILRESNWKLPQQNEAKLGRNNQVTPSDSNLKSSVGFHRRRNSSLI